MKHNRSLRRLQVEALALPEEILQALKVNRFRSVKDILAFGVFDAALVCKMDGNAPQLIEEALSVPPKGVTFFSRRTPFRAANSFEQKIQFSCSDDFLRLPITNLRLSARAIGILHHLHLKTISDILDYGPRNLAKFRSIGEATCANIENAILDLMDGELLDQQTKFPTLLDSLLPPDPDKRDVIKARFGFDTGKEMTLPEVAKSLRMSTHKVGKILIRERRKMTLGQAGIALYLLRQRVEIVLIRNGYIAAFEDILRYPFFRNCGRKHLSFLINLLCTLFPKNYRVIEDHYFTSLSPEEVLKRTNRLSVAYKRLLEQMAIAEAGSIEGFSPSFHYIMHCLQKNGNTNSPRRERNTKTAVRAVSIRKDRKTQINKIRLKDTQFDQNGFIPRELGDELTVSSGKDT
jgi:hypothetical protein